MPFLHLLFISTALAQDYPYASVAYFLAGGGGHLLVSSRTGGVQRKGRAPWGVTGESGGLRLLVCPFSFPLPICLAPTHAGLPCTPSLLSSELQAWIYPAAHLTSRPTCQKMISLSSAPLVSEWHINSEVSPIASIFLTLEAYSVSEADDSTSWISDLAAHTLPSCSH